jgi:hypothetical protein
MKFPEFSTDGKFYVPLTRAERWLAAAVPQKEGFYLFRVDHWLALH